MFLGAVSEVGRRSLLMTGSSSQRAAAEAAAESGLQYALARLRQDPNWRGQGNATIINTDELLVVEDEGNVVGVLNGNSRFRIRFNYQDGDDGGDSLPDPALRIDHRYVSVNNILFGTDRPVPRGDGPGAAVTASSEKPYTVPEFTVCLLVQGQAGSGISRDNLSSDIASRRVSSTVFEGFYRVGDISGLVLDAASMSAGEFTAELPNGSGMVTVDSRDSSRQPRIRSKSKVSVGGGASGANYLSEAGQVLSGDKTLDARPEGSVDVAQEDSDAGFYDLAWEDVNHADAAGASMPAGTYVWWDDGSLHFYDMNYPDYVKFIKSNPTHEGVGLPEFPAGVKVDYGSKKIVIESDVYIKPGTGSTLDGAAAAPEDFAVLPREGAPESPDSGIDLTNIDTTNQTLSTYFFENRETLRQFLLTTTGPTADWNVDGGQVDFYYENADNPSTFAIKLGSGGANDVRDPLGNGTMNYNEYELLESIFYYDPSLAGQSQEYLDAQGLLGAEGEIDLPGIEDALSPQNLGLEFRPAEGSTAVLTAEGDVRIGARLEGEGGSITSGGEIRVVGFGADFAADPDAESGVSMYAKGNITFSTYNVDKATGLGSFQDVKVKGVVYTWGNLQTKMGHEDVNDWGNFALEGALVAYGGQPGTAEEPGAPGSGEGGRVELRAASAHLTFDPAYLMGLMGTPPSNLEMTRSLWNRY